MPHRDLADLAAVRIHHPDGDLDAAEAERIGRTSFPLARIIDAVGAVIVDAVGSLVEVAVDILVAAVIFVVGAPGAVDRRLVDLISGGDRKAAPGMPRP